MLGVYSQKSNNVTGITSKLYAGSGNALSFLDHEQSSREDSKDAAKKKKRKKERKKENAVPRVIPTLVRHLLLPLLTLDLLLVCHRP